MAYDRVIKFRAGPEEERRLAALAQLTGDNPSAILRRLIHTAELVHRPTVTAGPLRSEESERIAA